MTLVSGTAREVNDDHDDAAFCLSCVICGEPFDFDACDSAVVLRHAAYGYDFAHNTACFDAANRWIFAEPNYDCATFAHDLERRRVIGVWPAEGWAVVLPSAPEEILNGHPIRLETLWCWALIERHDGSRHVEGIVRDDEWINEPGGAEFPEARSGSRAPLGYVRPTGRTDPELQTRQNRLLDPCLNGGRSLVDVYVMLPAKLTASAS